MYTTGIILLMWSHCLSVYGLAGTGSCHQQTYAGKGLFPGDNNQFYHRENIYDNHCQHRNTRYSQTVDSNRGHCGMRPGNEQTVPSGDNTEDEVGATDVVIYTDNQAGQSGRFPRCRRRWQQFVPPPFNPFPENFLYIDPFLIKRVLVSLTVLTYRLGTGLDHLNRKLGFSLDMLIRRLELDLDLAAGWNRGRSEEFLTRKVEPSYDFLMRDAMVSGELLKRRVGTILDLITRQVGVILDLFSRRMGITIEVLVKKVETQRNRPKQANHSKRQPDHHREPEFRQPSEGNRIVVRPDLLEKLRVGNALIPVTIGFKQTYYAQKLGIEIDFIIRRTGQSIDILMQRVGFGLEFIIKSTGVRLISKKDGSMSYHKPHQTGVNLRSLSNKIDIYSPPKPRPSCGCPCRCCGGGRRPARPKYLQLDQGRLASRIGISIEQLSSKMGRNVGQLARTVDGNLNVKKMKPIGMRPRLEPRPLPPVRPKHRQPVLEYVYAAQTNI